jgi:hypothetical protein
MLIDLYLLRHGGQPLRRTSLSLCARGHLRVVTWRLADATDNRLVRQADLRSMDSPSAPVVISLYDVTINRFDAQGLVLAGWVDLLHVERQAWWCKPLPSDGACAAPPFGGLR